MTERHRQREGRKEGQRREREQQWSITRKGRKEELSRNQPAEEFNNDGGKSSTQTLNFYLKTLQEFKKKLFYSSFRSFSTVTCDGATLLLRQP